MSSIKIPALDLFRNQRRGRNRQYEHVEREGYGLVRKGRHKYLLEQIKSSHYIETYKNNLKHFVSPSKHRDKAQYWINRHSKDENIMMKAKVFSSSRHICQNCVHYEPHQQQQKRCYCELGPPVNSIKKIRSAQKFYPQQKQRDLRHKEQQTSQNLFTERYEFRGYKIRNFIRNQQSQQIEEKKIQGQRQLKEPEQIQVIYQNVGNTGGKTDQETHYMQPDKINRHLQFIEHLSFHNNRLNSIDLYPTSSSVTQIDLSGLIEAKSSYVAKSKEIINSLDQILQKYK